jgi:hypothetical protein
MPRKPPESPELSLANFWSQTLAMFTKESILKIAENLNLRALSEIFQLLKTLLLVFSSLGVLLLIVVVQHRIRVLHISHISHIP